MNSELRMREFVAIIFGLFALAKSGYGNHTEGPDVVGGADAKLQEIPYQVSLQLFGYHFCGGSLVNAHYVLTAAHCRKGYNLFTSWGVSAVAGMVDLREPYQRRYMQLFISHEKFNDEFFYRYDIALVKVWTRFNFNSRVKPVRLPSRHLEVPADSAVILSGWGGLGGKDNPAPEILQKVALQVVDQARCKSLVERNGRDKLYNTNLCAYNPRVRKGQCSGDSGGPLIYGAVQVGIVSWSDKDPYCASTVTPGIYTRVPEYVDWINQHVKFNLLNVLDLIL